MYVVARATADLRWSTATCPHAKAPERLERALLKWHRRLEIEARQAR
jgi:hypothetical protein